MANNPTGATLAFEDKLRSNMDAAENKLPGTKISKSRRFHKDATVLLSSRAPIGYLGVAAVPASVNQGVIVLICDGDLPNLYVLQWTSAKMDLIKSRAGGTTFAEISRRNYRPIPVLPPAKPMLDAFMANVAPLHERITLNVRQNRRLPGLRDTLLPKLLSGEIDVGQVDRAIEQGASAR